MAFTPIDPNKAEVRITGEAPNYGLDFYIPRGERGEVGPTGPQGPAVPTNLSIGTIEVGPAAPGTVGPQGPTGPKGDPGGFVGGTDLTGLDLNNIVAPGIYRKNSTGTGLLALHYPNDTDSGVLTVLERVASATVTQTWHSFSPTSGVGGGVFYRVLNGAGNWTAWRFMATQRVDQTAGRVFYQWDYANNREQLIYGSTGLRDISSMVDTTYYSMPGGVPSGYAAYIRRNGNNVHLSLRVTVVAANASGVVMFTLPTGFRADATVTAIGLLEGGTATPVACQVTPTGGFRVWHAAASGVLTVNLPFTSLDSWPTTLPGTYGGVIPNT